MKRWFNDFQALIYAATIAAVALVWAYQSFATINYVDQKHASVMDVLNDIRVSVHTIDQRTFELAQRKH